MLKEPPKNSPKKQLDRYIRFSAIGLQMAMTILLLSWAGVKLDQYLGLKIPVFTLVLSLASVAGSLYYFIKQVTKP